MLRELAESDVSGELATIYEEIRRYSAVPYVSSLQRHLATMPGCLEYAWMACRPALENGFLQHTAWRLAQAGDFQPFPPVSVSALRLLGVSATDAREIQNIYANFVRVAPVNLLFAGVVERLLAGARPGGKTLPSSPPPLPGMLPPMAALVPHEQLDPGAGDVLMQLATELGGEPFVPGLYRLLAAWPAYLAHVATLVEPVLKSESEREARRQTAMRIVEAADEVIEYLPALDERYPAPATADAQAILSAIMTYRVTSPEMIVFGTLLLNTLPEASDLD